MTTKKLKIQTFRYVLWTKVEDHWLEGMLIFSLYHKHITLMWDGVKIRRNFRVRNACVIQMDG